MATLERLAWEDVDWDTLDRYPDRTVFQTPAWLRFIAHTQGAEPVVAALRDGEEELGFFTGLIVRKYGARILGSPFPGWTTSYMGFNLKDGVSRRDAVQALPALAFRQLGCVHWELLDQRLRTQDVSGLGLGQQRFQSFEIDLTRGEDELFANMSSACRRCIRKAQKTGVVIEEASDASFADEYYGQLRDVFAKQSLVPTYNVERVRALIRDVYPTGSLLLLRARDNEGRSIATGIFPAFNDVMYFWGGASWRAHQELRPNEAIQWYAMLYWKAHGIRRYDMGGGGEYKRKYGAREIVTPFVRCSRYPGIERMRALGQRIVQMRQEISGKVVGGPAHTAPAEESV